MYLESKMQKVENSLKNISCLLEAVKNKCGNENKIILIEGYPVLYPNNCSSCSS